MPKKSLSLYHPTDRIREFSEADGAFILTSAGGTLIFQDGRPRLEGPAEAFEGFGDRWLPIGPASYHLSYSDVDKALVFRCSELSMPWIIAAIDPTTAKSSAFQAWLQRCNLAMKKPGYSLA